MVYPLGAARQGHSRMSAPPPVLPSTAKAATLAGQEKGDIMKKFAAVALVALALGGCTMESQEDQLENSIRSELGNQGSTVQEVELTKQENGNMTGYAVVREASGRTGRLACTAGPTGGSSTNFSWHCSPAIDQAVEQEMNGIVRREYESRGAEVLEVAMHRANDDNHMTGTARVRDGSGTESRLTCSAERDANTPGTFGWQCAPAGEGAAAAPAAPAEAAAPEGDSGEGETK
jgi:hypothetical protein